MTVANVCIDLNADLGEGGEYDAELLQVVSSCNIACGGHAGGAESMARTVRLAIGNGVAVGAHPSYPDRDGFGRRSSSLGNDALYESLAAQAEALLDVAGSHGARVVQLKPHGALYNDAAQDAGRADVIARVASEMPGDLCLFGPPGSELERAAADTSVAFVAEAFVDRAYRADGRLVARGQPAAVHEDVGRMVAQALSLATRNEVATPDGAIVRIPARTLCVHGDTPEAAEAARTIRRALEESGVVIASAGRGR